MEVLERMPFTAKKIFERLAEIADSSCLTQEEREKYDESKKVADDYYSGIYGAWEEGIETGRAEGMEKGRAEGEIQKSLVIARNLLSMGLPVLQVMQATGLTKEQIDKLKK